MGYWGRGMRLRDYLFRGMEGCSNHSCVITGKKKGMGTNGPCHCIDGLSRSQVAILQSRLAMIGDYNISIEPPTDKPNE